MASPARAARLTSFSFAPTPLHSAAAGRTKTDSQRPCDRLMLHSVALHSGKLQRLAKTRRRESGHLPAPVPRKHGKRQALHLRRTCPHSLPPKVSLTSVRPCSASEPCAHPRWPTAKSPCALHGPPAPHSRPEVRTDLLKRHASNSELSTTVPLRGTLHFVPCRKPRRLSLQEKNRQTASPQFSPDRLGLDSAESH
jgi:hypothetical protein